MFMAILDLSLYHSYETYHVSGVLTYVTFEYHKLLHLRFHHCLRILLSYSKDSKVMAPHSRTLAWKIPWMEEPGGLQSMGLLRVGHD